MTPTRYRFASFVVSPRHRVLLREGAEVPLIPRYFDLLVLLLERRHEAVHRQAIFTHVWTDVIVSDGALSQAIRTLRRTLDDDSREPVFIRTVARHGYQFVFPEVVEEPDEGPLAPAAAHEDPPADRVERGEMAGQAAGATAAPPEGTSISMTLETLLERLTAEQGVPDGDRRDAAERLHVMGTRVALDRLGDRPGCARARAMLRDARWDVPGAGPVPLLGQPGGWAAAAHLVRLRLARMRTLASGRWLGGAWGGATAGALAGASGGSILAALPHADTPSSAIGVLAAIGAAAGALGAAGIGAGLAAAEVVARSRRGPALVAGGAAGGLAIGAIAQYVVAGTLEGLFGLRLPDIGGAFEGTALGAAAGAGYAAATPRQPGGGLATPRGRERVLATLVVALCCGAAALALSALGRPMVGGLVNAIARASQGSQMALAPLGRLVGEPEFGPITRLLVGAAEGALFGAGLAFGLTRRPSGR